MHGHSTATSSRSRGTFEIRASEHCGRRLRGCLSPGGAPVRSTARGRPPDEQCHQRHRDPQRSTRRARSRSRRSDASASSVYGLTRSFLNGRRRPRFRFLLTRRPSSPARVCTQLSTACLDSETVSLRYFNVFGPLQDPSSHYAAVIPRFIGALLAGRPPVIYGDGRRVQGLHVRRERRSRNMLAIHADGASGVYNVAVVSVSAERLVAELRDLAAPMSSPCMPLPDQRTSNTRSPISHAQDPNLVTSL